jgi:predicted protein tyrosine phosphatase
MYQSSSNRVWNFGNPHQGKAKKVLCVCSAGLLRSPTAANVLHSEFGFNTRAVGIDGSYALVPIHEDMHEWAEIVVAMEPWMAEDLVKRWGFTEDQVLCLNIPDQYEYMNAELQSLIITNFKKLTQVDEIQ